MGLEFERAREDLRAWAVSADRPAFERFYRAFLADAVRGTVNRFRLAPADAADLEGLLFERFVDRIRAAKLGEADSPAYWHRALSNGARDFLRALRRRRHWVETAGEPSAVEAVADESAPDEQSLTERLSGAAERHAVDLCLGRLTPGRRRALTAFTWDRFASAFSPGDAHDLAVKARRSPAAIVAILAASTPYDATTSVAVFASDHELETRREICLDSYRRARGRATEDLGRMLAASATAPTAAVKTPGARP